MIPVWSILMGQAKTLHIHLDTIPPSLPCRPLCRIPSYSVFIHHLSQSASSLRSTCPNHHNLLFLIVRIKSQQYPNLCIFLVVLQFKTTHPSKHTHLIAIQLCFMLHLHWPSLADVNQTTSYTTCIYLVFQF